MGKLQRLSLVGALIFLSACSTRNCREERENDRAATPVPAKALDLSKEASIADVVRVYKPDGSVQCGSFSAISVEAMQKQLGNIQVLNAAKRNDGLLRAQQCGLPTGNSNVYTIYRKDLAAALKLGFQEWVHP